MSDAQDDPKSTQPDAAAPESVTEAGPPPAQAPIAKRRGSVDEIAHAAGRTERRMRFVRALAWGTTALCVGLGAAGITLAIRKTDTIGDKATKALLVAEGLAVFAVASAGWMRRLPNRAGAITLDRHHGLHDRLSSALSFADEKERSPFMDAAIDDALAVVHTVEPRKAVPVKAPRDLAMAAVLGLAVTAVALFEVREHKPAISQKTIDPVDVTADDLDAMRDFLKDQEMKNQSDEAKEATKEFNQLIEDLAAKRLDRTEAFRRMQALEDKLLQGREVDHKQLEEQLQQIGEALKKSDMSKPAGEALDQHNLSDAQKQLRDLANKLRQNGGQIDKAQLEKLREALKQASQDAEKHKEAVEKARDQAKQELSLLKQKQGDAGPQTDEERSLLEKKERELDRLEHELQQADATQRQLDKLDQDLQKAAEDLMKDLGLSAQDLENGAEDLNKMQQQEMTQQEKEELKQKLDELREMLRQQGQGGQQQMVRLQKFQQQAHGQGGQQGQGQGQGQQQGGQQQGQGGQQGQGQQGQGQQGQGQQGQGQQGQGQQGQGQQGQGQNGQGQNGQGQNGQGQNGQGQNGQGQNGQGQGQNGQGQGQGAGQGGAGGSQPGPGPGEVWVIGPNGEKILVLTKGQGQGQGQGQGGQGQGGQGGQGGQQGPGWGTGSGGNPQGQQSSIKYGTQDSQIAGQDTGQGGSRSEVIQGAAERGFASRGYQKVYREYHTVAEEALNKDEIPGGYRFYVKRYFQLIRPRDQ